MTMMSFKLLLPTSFQTVPTGLSHKTNKVYTIWNICSPESCPESYPLPDEAVEAVDLKGSFGAVGTE
jgi:hypothetical protein